MNPDAEKIFRLDWSRGRSEVLATLGDDGVFVDKSYAEDHHLPWGRR